MTSLEGPSERERWEHEIGRTEREFVLRERELAAREAEFQLARLDYSRARWRNPFTLSVKALASVGIAYWAATTYVDTTYNSTIWKDRYGLCKQSTQLMGYMLGGLGHPEDPLHKQYAEAYPEVKRLSDSKQFTLYQDVKLENLLNEFIAESPTPGDAIPAEAKERKDWVDLKDKKMRETHSAFTAECQRTTRLLDLLRKGLHL